MGSHAAPYDFAPFLDTSRAAREDDPLLAAWLEHHRVQDDHRAWLDNVAEHAHGVLRESADHVERSEHLPRLLGKGPYDNDPQQVVLPAETWEALAWVHNSGIWDDALPEVVRYAAVYLLNQNGEMGLNCSVACTDGLWRVLRRFPEDERSQSVLQALACADDEDWVHGAQFVTEIQGGSDAGQNAVIAKNQGDTWTLHGQKWFCSNLTADYWLVTARPENAPAGSKGVALFCVPRDQPGYSVERLKDKLGTRALPTAEIVFHGAEGWLVGPPDKGLATMVSQVLVTSRVHNVIAAAAFIRSAQREARAYAAFRTAFGQRLDEMPLVADSLEQLDQAADRTQAGAFATIELWREASRRDADEATRSWARVLVSLAKAITTRRAPETIYRAMMVLGGNGIEERFTLLPRLWRDSAILETWEGPYTLLLMNALEDLTRARVAGNEESYLTPWLGDTEAIQQAISGLKQVLKDPKDPENIRQWPHVAEQLYAAWEEQALARLQARS